MSEKSLSQLNKDLFTLTKVYKETIELDQDFLDLAAKFTQQEGTVLLYSGGDHELAQHHMLGINPLLSITGHSNKTYVSLNGQQHKVDAQPLQVLDHILQTMRLKVVDDLPINCGLLGYLSYDLKQEIENIPRTSVDDLNLPDLLLYLHSVLLIHDLKSNKTTLLAPIINGNHETAQLAINSFKQEIDKPGPAQTFSIGERGPVSNFSQKNYEQSVQRVIDYIKAGDAYQVNLSQRFTTPFAGNSFGYFKELCTNNPAPFFAYIQGGDHQIVSTSPERFVHQTGRHVETRPIKGTRPRSGDPEQDKVMRQELINSRKDGAELAMIVDLLRNDIGKVCEAGSVKVTDDKRVETYTNVFHLVSIIEGRLEDNRTSADLIKATFPGGSITGCPKIRAMEIIDELEPCSRHIYCGSIGYISFHDTMDLSIAIRTATIVNDTLLFSVGGGIVYDSTPKAEYEETLHKGRTLMNVCQQAEPLTHIQENVWLNGNIVDINEASLSVTDQALLYGNGFFETILATNGTCPLLADHIDRFNLTWQKLFVSPTPYLSWNDIIVRVLEANGLENRQAAIKILATRGSRTTPPWDHTLLVTARPYTHRLSSIAKDGIAAGIYPFPRQNPLAELKTTNYLYYLHAGQWAKHNKYDEAIILNPDQTISETNTAALFIVKNSTIIRPHSHGALNSVMAAAAAKLLTQWGWTVTEQAMQISDLLQADHAFLTNALMGAVPLLFVDNLSMQYEKDLCQKINLALNLI